MRSVAVLGLLVGSILPAVLPSGNGLAQTITAGNTIFVSEVPFRAERGSLEVPESRSRPGGRQLALGYLRFRSLSPEPGPPTFWLAGGPGISGAADIRSAGHVLMSLLTIGDVVVLDQRGTRGSSSDLDCADRWQRPADRPGSWDVIVPAMRAALERCVRHFDAQGVDFKAYTTSENAADVNDLRRALGYDRINLFGTSYGTHLGMELLRTHGGSIHRAVLAAFYWARPGETHPDESVEQVLAPLAERIRADTTASRLLPDPLGTVTRLLRELDLQPAIVDLVGPDAGDAARVTIGRFDAELALSGADSHRNNATRWLVRTLVDVARGDLTRLANGVWSGGRLNGMATAIGCSEGMHMHDELYSLCSVVPHIDRRKEFQEYFSSDVPVLFVAGTMDVDLADVRAWRPHLSASELLLLDNGFHDDYYWLWSLYEDHVLRFMRGGRVDGEIVTLPLEFDF